MTAARLKSHRGAWRNREAEVRLILESAGLPLRARRVFRRLEDSARHGHDVRAVCAALRSLGPVFCAFGVYLSSRVDLLPRGDLLALAGLSGDAPATPPAAVRGFVAQQTRAFMGELFREFADEPFERRLLSQTHQAVLRDGVAVTVKLLHPGAEERLTPDLDLLVLLEGAMAHLGISPEAMAEAAADFSRSLKAQLDLPSESRWLDSLAADADSFDLLDAPVVCRHLSTPGLLTVVSPSGVGFSARSMEREEHTRRLCVAWLRQALLGSAFPVEFPPERVLFTDQGRVSIPAAAFDRLPKDAQVRLLDYLLAALREDASRACSFLTKELCEAGANEGGERLLKDFQQAVPYRSGTAGGLSGRLWMYWRIASANGCRPHAYMASFYRGLYSLSALAVEVAPNRDLLAEAVQDVHVMAGVARFRSLLDPGQMAAGMERYATLLLEAPRLLDDGLTAAYTGNARVRLQMPETAREKKKRNSFAVLIALLLALPALGLVTRYVASLTASAGWAERIDAAVVLVFGGLILRSVGRAV